MTSRSASQCGLCKHFRSPLDAQNDSDTPTCAAFPDAIPGDIWWNRADHRDPQPGDHGIQWSALNDAEFPEYALNT